MTDTLQAFLDNESLSIDDGGRITDSSGDERHNPRLWVMMGVYCLDCNYPRPMLWTELRDYRRQLKQQRKAQRKGVKDAE